MSEGASSVAGQDKKESKLPVMLYILETCNS